jgi:hypothetical protein
MENQLITIVNQSGLDQTKSQYILEKFTDYFAIAAEWEAKAKMITVTNENQKADMEIARVGRLLLREKRIAIEKSRKELKEQSLRESRAIDGIANVLKGLIEPIEEYLDQQEHFIEYKQKAEREEKLRILMLEEQKKKEDEEKRNREEQERIRKENEELKQKQLEQQRVLEAQQKKAQEEQRKLQEKIDEEKRIAKQKEIEAQRKLQEIQKKQEEEKRAIEQKAKLTEKKLKQAKIEIKEIKKQMVKCPKCGHEF